jgi:predicted  nucleic acid-binding Zn-ribbon protein
MSWGGPQFVLAIIGMSMIGWIITTAIRAKHGYPLEGEWGGLTDRQDPENNRKIELLSNENGELKDKIVRLEERISVLERIATDKSARLSDEIESLRGSKAN